MASRDKPMDELMMLQCLSLAEKGAGYVSPNPMVGSVLVRKGKIIGQGFHGKFGGPHAEVNAIRSAKQSVKGATLYVNLEPCNHFGKTPPCTELIISSGISRVVIGMKDPNPMVRGKGISRLRRAGIEVNTGILEDECETLNESFLKYITTGLPFVILKAAQTLDGKIADRSGKSRWISNETSRTIVHKFRSMYDAVMVGAGTVMSDNPELTVRNISGRNPVRVILDGRLRAPLSSNVFKKAAQSKTIVFTSRSFAFKEKRKKEELLSRGIEVIELHGKQNGSLPLRQVLKALGSLGIASLLVEGGASLYSTFLKENMADKLFLFVSPKILGTGVDTFRFVQNKSLAGARKTHDLSVIELDGDILIETYLQ